ncbi:MAG: hypothetical protein KDC53_01160, partial [Saprospiraceae bacterium]|nr:hypothetical protein [Saprospiraceae bacterium]
MGAFTGPVKEIQHPRLLMTEGGESGIRSLTEKEPVWEKMHLAILRRCNTFLGKPLLERKLIGRRLLSVSRECLRRVFYLSYAYRMTDDTRYLERAEKEMLAVAAFSDWNPSHFLDVAEMTMGMAIGYDWLYSGLPDDSRRSIREAIAAKGLRPSFNSGDNWFVRSDNNWNQVCNAGLGFGALAIEGYYPELSKQIIDRAMESVALPMAAYEPDGAYPEGYGYWDYGTTMNVLLLQVLEDAYNIDLTTSAPGFQKTPEFMLHMLGYSLDCFNWGDCSLKGQLQPAMFWFANKSADPSLLWMEEKYLHASD